MLFNSALFVFGFVPAVSAGFFWIQLRDKPWKRIRAGSLLGWLILCSFAFYGYWKPSGLLLLAVLVGGNGLIGRKIIDARAKAGPGWLYAGVAFNLGILAYFKYAGFFVQTLNDLMGSGLAVPRIALPLAISFVTFQMIAFLADCHQKRIDRWDWKRFLVFATFFPQLIAGPIVHYRQIEPQLVSARFRSVQWENVVRGIFLFWAGLAKKWLIADSLVPLVAQGMQEAAWRADFPFFEAWRVTLSYSLQIYFDFSGYSSMALGLALIFGIRLPINFNAPYGATSLVDFWKRWHITLSEFLRDYLYIPLGGNKKGPARRYVNLLITMVLGGLWHGAGWGFVLWGALHGVALALNHGWRLWRNGKSASGKPPRPQHPAYRAVAWAATFGFVTAAWVPFRTESIAAAVNIWKGMLGINGGWTTMIYFPKFGRSLSYVLQQFQSSQYSSHFFGINAVAEAAWIALLLSIASRGITSEQWAQKFRPGMAWAVGLGILVFWFIHSGFAGAPSEFIYFRF